MVKKVKKTLGEMLLENGLLTQEQFNEAGKLSRSGHPFRKALIVLGVLSENDLANFIAEQTGIPRIDLNNHLIDPKIIELIPEELARKHQIIPILKIGNTLTCAMIDAFNILALDEIRLKTGYTIDPAIVTEEEMRRALDQHYSVSGSFEELIASLDEKTLGLKDDSDVERLKGLVQEPPVIRLVNMMVLQAIGQGVSDIHIEPEENCLTIRFRVDGVLCEQVSPPKHFQSAIISRIKILANLDISERRRPQDGRFQMKMETHEIDIRVSCVPTIHGENVVLRLLNTSNILFGLEELGVDKENLEQFKKLLTRPNGILLVTGPTGSGKTTTIYAALNSIRTTEKNIITVEDPVEYRLKGIRQIQVNPDVNLTFANGLRSILRQDPDIIMVGEIRDLETAEIAIQAALTGHLVLATLHTNDAPGAATRLIDMGIEPFLISSTVAGVLAQRLVRILCRQCEGKGCQTCLNKGYKGRTGIYELMVVNDQIRRLIKEREPTDRIRQAAQSTGMKALYEDGMDKVKNGVTSQEEILRVTLES